MVLVTFTLVWVLTGAIICNQITDNSGVFANDTKQSKCCKCCECSKCGTTDIHLTVKAHDKDTELEVKVDNQKVHREVLDSGMNFLQYRTKEDKPKVKVLSPYGDTIRLKLENVNGEWYAYLNIKPPKKSESVGE